MGDFLFAIRCKQDSVELELNTGDINGRASSQILSPWPRVLEMVFLLELWSLASTYLIKSNKSSLTLLEEGIYNAESVSKFSM